MLLKAYNKDQALANLRRAYKDEAYFRRLEDIARHNHDLDSAELYKEAAEYHSDQVEKVEYDAKELFGASHAERQANKEAGQEAGYKEADQLARQEKSWDTALEEAATRKNLRRNELRRGAIEGGRKNYHPDPDRPRPDLYEVDEHGQRVKRGDRTDGRHGGRKGGGSGGSAPRRGGPPKYHDDSPLPLDEQAALKDAGEAMAVLASLEHGNDKKGSGIEQKTKPATDKGIV